MNPGNVSWFVMYFEPLGLWEAIRTRNPDRLGGLRSERGVEEQSLHSMGTRDGY